MRKESCADVAKSLGLRAWSWRDVDVLSGGEDTDLRLHGDVAARADELGGRVRISLTPSRGTAGAVALAV